MQLKYRFVVGDICISLSRAQLNNIVKATSAQRLTASKVLTGVGGAR